MYNMIQQSNVEEKNVLWPIKITDVQALDTKQKGLVHSFYDIIRRITMAGFRQPNDL